ncbi:DUF1292 domain-containing protein [Coprococcus catus]|jgi:uncharacterized protein YrzB (UPF0473 family)|uniref:DUF1292 domain-containing protein n=1 Tax=Coprococcus catus TaxID=116085 RepID=UPI001C8BF988|nr:DUF1292 domain-containing protein [Coprococcus catus]MBX9230221.1 DUF1292 domain-containing protein [Coprococcus catus]MCT6798725.1 DUF1292 domain-containing protein [Coprococcus catus]
MGIEENEEMDEFDTVTLEMEDGSEVEFAILDEFDMDTEKFVLLSEIEGDSISSDPERMLFMKAIADESCEEDEVILNVIEDPEQYNAVVEFYAELD